MTARQLYYTSRDSGDGGPSGFRFVAMSAGVRPDVAGQVERLVGYEPPAWASLSPDATEIDTFPVAFSHTVLADGTSAICHSRYVGTDYTGRYGNFFAHILHLDHRDDGDSAILPVELWHSPVWVDPAVGTAAVGPLQILDHVPAGTAVSRARVADFAAEQVEHQAQRLEAFLGDVHRILEPSSVQQIMIVTQDPSEAVDWVALACYSLPYADAMRVTFTTYTRRPHLATQKIIGVQDADLPAPAVYGSARFRVLDLVGDRSSTPVPDTWAAVAAQIWAAGRPDVFALVAGKAMTAGDMTAGDMTAGDGDAGREDAAGRLAAVALAEDVPLNRVSTDLAVAWMIRTIRGSRQNQATGSADERLWTRVYRGLARAVDGISLGDLATLCAAVEHRPRPESDRLVAVYLARLLRMASRPATGGDCAERTWLPAAPVGPHVADQVGAAFGARDRAGLTAVVDRAFDDVLDGARGGAVAAGADAPVLRCVLLLVRLADLFAIDITRQASLLGPRLLVPALLGSDRAPVSARVATEILRHGGLGELDRAVLDRLCDLVAEGDVAPVAAVVAGPGGDWLRAADLHDHAHLRAFLITQAASSTGSSVDTFTLVCDVLTPSVGGRAAAEAARLVWADRPLTTGEAVDLLRRVRPDVLRTTDLPQRAAAGLAADRAPDSVALALAHALGQPSFWDALGTGQQATVNVVRNAAQMSAGRAPRGATARFVYDLALADPMPEQLRAWACRSAAEWLVSRRASVDPVELRALVLWADDELASAYVEAARRLLPRTLARSPRDAAWFFHLWWSELTGDDQPSAAWERAQATLLEEVLRPAVRRMSADNRDLLEVVLRREQGQTFVTEWDRWLASRPSVFRRFRLLRRGGMP